MNKKNFLLFSFLVLFTFNFNFKSKAASIVKPITAMVGDGYKIVCKHPYLLGALGAFISYELLADVEDEKIKNLFDKLGDLFFKINKTLKVSDYPLSAYGLAKFLYYGILKKVFNKSKQCGISSYNYVIDLRSALKIAGSIKGFFIKHQIDKDLTNCFLYQAGKLNKETAIEVSQYLLIFNELFNKNINKKYQYNDRQNQRSSSFKREENLNKNSKEAQNFKQIIINSGAQRELSLNKNINNYQRFQQVNQFIRLSDEIQENSNQNSSNIQIQEGEQFEEGVSIYNSRNFEKKQELDYLQTAVVVGDTFTDELKFEQSSGITFKKINSNDQGLKAVINEEIISGAGNVITVPINSSGKGRTTAKGYYDNELNNVLNNNTYNNIFMFIDDTGDTNDSHVLEALNKIIQKDKFILPLSLWKRFKIVRTALRKENEQQKR